MTAYVVGRHIIENQLKRHCVAGNSSWTVHPMFLSLIGCKGAKRKRSVEIAFVQIGDRTLFEEILKLKVRVLIRIRRAQQGSIGLIAG